MPLGLWPLPEIYKVEWVIPWHSVADNPAQVAGIERELARELSVGHPLYGLPMRTLARRQDCDDVLFAIEDGSDRVAVVHLTFSGSPEKPPWPGTSLFPSLSAWAADDMKLDSERFED